MNNINIKRYIYAIGLFSILLAVMLYFVIKDIFFVGYVDYWDYALIAGSVLAVLRIIRDIRRIKAAKEQPTCVNKGIST